MDIVQLLRTSAENGRGRMLTADQISYLLGAMGRMAYERQMLEAAATQLDMICQAYQMKFGEIPEDELVDIMNKIEQEVEAEIIADEESE